MPGKLVQSLLMVWKCECDPDAKCKNQTNAPALQSDAEY